MITYKDAGVDIEKGDALVEKIKSKVSGTYGNRVLSGVGGFASRYLCRLYPGASGTNAG